MQLKGWSVCSGFRWSVCSGFAWSASSGFRWSVSPDFPGKRNRSTIAREILGLNAKFPESVWVKLKEQYPALEKEMAIEEMMAVVQADKAIRKQDTLAYRAIMDSAYGQPKQEFEIKQDPDLSKLTVEELKQLLKLQEKVDSGT